MPEKRLLLQSTLEAALFLWQHVCLGIDGFDDSCGLLSETAAAGDGGEDGTLAFSEPV
jgi:hypothetical protein